MALDVFEYQKVGAAALSTRNRYGLFDEMRVGKSAQAIRAADLLGAKRGIVICPGTAREVWRGEFTKFGIIPRSLVKGVDIHDYVSWMRGRFDVLITSYEQAVRWADKIHNQGEVLDFCVIDECFPYDTPVLTDAGPLAIGEIVEKRLDVRVWSFDNGRLVLRPIVRYVTTSSVELVKVAHDRGSFVCTPNHKIRTNRGFVVAAELRRDDYLFVVPQAAYQGGEVPLLQHEVFSAASVANEAEGRTSSDHGDREFASSRDATPRRGYPHAALKCRSGVSRQSGRRCESAERQIVYRSAGRQWFYDGAATFALEDVAVGGVSHGVVDRDGRRAGSVSVAAALLQGGLGAPHVNDGDRSGRPLAQQSESAVFGPPENGSVTRSRVVRVAPVQSGSSDGSQGGGAESAPTYNLEVAETHNYFAAGVNVGNCHYLKNSEAARTKAIFGDFTKPPGKGAPGIADWAKHTWGLTGTPMANDPMDIYTFLRFVNAMPLTQAAFQKRYFHEFKKTYGSRNTPKKEHVEELKRLIQNNSLRRTQKQAGLNFPPIFLTTLTIEGDTTELREMLAQHPGLDAAIVQAVNVGGLSFLDAQHIATLRRLIAEAKAIPYAAMLFEELQNTSEKFVIMGISKQALISIQNYLTAHGITSVLVNGDVPEKHRGPLIEAFQTDPRVRVFLGNLKSAGTAISLTASCYIDVFESAWDPATNAQGLMRVQGVSQKRNITARFIGLANSLDDAVNQIVAGKTASIAAIQGTAMYAHAPVDGGSIAA